MLADREHVDLQQFTVATLDSGLDSWLAGLGVRVMPGFVYDENCLPLQVGVDPVETNIVIFTLPRLVAVQFIGSGAAAVA